VAGDGPGRGGGRPDTTDEPTVGGGRPAAKRGERQIAELVELPDDDRRSPELRAADEQPYVPEQPEWLMHVLPERDRGLPLPAWLKAAGRDEALTATDRLVLHVLALEHFTSKRMHGRSRQVRLGKLVGCSRQAINAAVGRLKDHGWLKATGVVGRDSLRYWARYPSRVTEHELNPVFGRLVTFRSHVERRRKPAAKPEHVPPVNQDDTLSEDEVVAQDDRSPVKQDDTHLSSRTTQKSPNEDSAAGDRSVSRSLQDARAREESITYEQALARLVDAFSTGSGERPVIVESSPRYPGCRVPGCPRRQFGTDLCHVHSEAAHCV
jgi:hypothetical protein